MMLTRRALVKKIMLSGIAARHVAGWVPLEENFTTLFLGDSITNDSGNRSRNLDWNHVLGHGYVYLIASRLWCDHPSKGFHFFNRGVSGNKVTDLAARWQQDTLDIKPQLLSILVGVNDANSMFTHDGAVTADVYREVYAGLLTRTRERLPGIRIVLCEPFLLPVGRVKDQWKAWSAEMKVRQTIVRELAARFNATFVPLQEEFDKACEKAPPDYWIWDGIHPMPGGHELIARKWIRVVLGH